MSLYLINTFKPLYLEECERSKMYQDAFIKAICLNSPIVIMNLEYTFDGKEWTCIDLEKRQESNDQQ